MSIEEFFGLILVASHLIARGLHRQRLRARTRDAHAADARRLALAWFFRFHDGLKNSRPPIPPYRRAMILRQISG